MSMGFDPEETHQQRDERVAELYDALAKRIGNCVPDARDRVALVGGIEELIAVLQAGDGGV